MGFDPGREGGSQPPQQEQDGAGAPQPEVVDTAADAAADAAATDLEGGSADAARTLEGFANEGDAAAGTPESGSPPESASPTEAEKPYEGWIDRLAVKRDEIMDRVREKSKKLAARTRTRLITYPADRMKEMGTNAVNFFVDRGVDFTNRQIAKGAEVAARYNERKAEKYKRKKARIDKRSARMERYRGNAEKKGNVEKAQRYAGELLRRDERSTDLRNRAMEYKGRAAGNREQAKRLRTGRAVRQGRAAA